MNELQFKELINRYLDRTASAADLDQLNKLEQLFPTTDDAILASDQEKHRFLKARIYRNILGKIQPVKYVRWLSAAVAVAIIAVLFLPKEKPVIGNNKEIVYKLIKTDNGKIKEIQLRDGTTVILNAGSSLSYPFEFNDSIREVKLIGQAFFKVKHHASKPFLVHTGALTTRVLGTSFDVYAYPESQDVRITLVTGRINISEHKTKVATLIPNQQLVFNVNKNTAKMIQVNAADYSGWKIGQQAFKQSSLEEISLYMNKWYGLGIAFNNESLKNYKITTRFTSNMPVKQVLDIIAASTCSKYTLHDQTVVFSGKGCQINRE
jgi:transmembrane sensor